MQSNSGRETAFTSPLEPLPHQQTGKLGSPDDTSQETSPIEDDRSREISPIKGPLLSPADDTSDVSSPEEFPFRGGENRRRSYATIPIPPYDYENEGADNEIDEVEEREEHSEEKASTENKMRDESDVLADLDRNSQDKKNEAHTTQRKAEDKDRIPGEASTGRGAAEISNDHLGFEEPSTPEAPNEDSDPNDLYGVEDNYVPPSLRTASKGSAQAPHTAGEPSQDKSDDKNDTVDTETVMDKQDGIIHTMGSVDGTRPVDKLEPDEEREPSSEKNPAVGKTPETKKWINKQGPDEQDPIPKTESNAEDTYPPISAELKPSLPSSHSPEQTTTIPSPPPTLSDQDAQKLTLNPSNAPTASGEPSMEAKAVTEDLAAKEEKIKKPNPSNPEEFDPEKNGWKSSNLGQLRNGLPSEQSWDSRIGRPPSLLISPKPKQRTEPRIKKRLEILATPKSRE